MKIELIRELTGYKYFKAKDCYNVILLDGIWMCDCSLKYNRPLNSNCHHIDECKKFINKQVYVKNNLKWLKVNNESIDKL